MRSIYCLVALLGFALLTPVVTAQSQDPPKASPQAPNAPSAGGETTTIEAPVRFNVEFGAQYPFHTEGDRWTKFVEHRDIPKNFTLNQLDFSVGGHGRWSLVGSALDAGQLDQRYRVVLEKFGTSRTSFRFVGWPNYISRAVTSPYQEVAAGVLTLPSPFRTAFENAASDAARISLVNDLVGNTQLASLRTRRDRFLVDQAFNLSQHWFVSANVMYERRNGHRPIGVGAYNRSRANVNPLTAVPVLGTRSGGATFAAFSDELPEPAEYRNTEFRAALGYQSNRGMIRFEYTGSWFQNEIQNLVWSNPFELTACVATDDPAPNTPACANGTTLAAAAGTNGRWRLDRDYILINPDNRANTFTVSGRVNLPGSSFFSALLAYSMRRQDDRFGPYTLSTAPFTAPVVLTDPVTAPQNNLDGEVNTITGSAVLGTRHWKTLLLTAHYRAFNYNNNTPIVSLPGIIDMSSFFTTNFDATPVTAFEVPSSYLRQNASIEAVWRPSREFQFRLAPSLETWNRSRRNVGRTNEWGGDAGLIAQPVKWVNAKIKYHYGDRIPETTFVPSPNEFVELRVFDQDRRITHNPSIVLNFGGKGPWLLSANYSYFSQAHDQNLFGLGKYLRGNVGVDLNYAPSDRWGLAVYYSHERIGYRYRSAAKENPPADYGIVVPNCPTCAEQFWLTATRSDEWDRHTRDKADSFGVAFNMLSSNQKWQFNASYDFSLAKQVITTTNPLPTFFPIDANGHPFPEVKSDFHELFLDGSYAIHANWRAGVRYIFSPYRLTDFTNDNLTPFLPVQSATPLPGTIDPQTNAVRFLILNSRYASADSHMLGVYLRYTF